MWLVISGLVRKISPPFSSTTREAHRATGARGSPLAVPKALFDETFQVLRYCGRGRAECQVLWIGPWAEPTQVSRVVHPQHHAHRGGFVVDDSWLTQLWTELAASGDGIRAQVHTHPREAFHSATDDAWPVVHLSGFLSLVIPDFAQGPITLDRSYLAELGDDGHFLGVDPGTRLHISVSDVGDAERHDTVHPSM